MRYVINQKIFTFGDDFSIMDYTGREVYFVKGKVFSLGDKLKMYDNQGQEVVNIRQKIMAFLPEYYIDLYGQEVARVKKQFTFFSQRFNIDSSLGSYEICGNIVAHNFTIYKNGTLIAEASKKWLAIRDSYTVDIEESENHAFILALCIIIDQALHDNNRNNK
ncbi:LURP-one-related/scramblase family protein [Clostridium tunisiense]|uniref:LURP-one-related/scramblase family protein n=1 Tax=Clostridium tunisiense TaxID=219748 RepID=UPI0002DCDE61|nr:LURP-one-related family protein [Clostridium tunisiense]